MRAGGDPRYDRETERLAAQVEELANEERMQVDQPELQAAQPHVLRTLHLTTNVLVTPWLPSTGRHNDLDLRKHAKKVHSMPWQVM